MKEAKYENGKGRQPRIETPNWGGRSGVNGGVIKTKAQNPRKSKEKEKGGKRNVGVTQVNIAQQLTIQKGAEP